MINDQSTLKSMVAAVQNSVSMPDDSVPSDVGRGAGHEGAASGHVRTITRKKPVAFIGDSHMETLNMGCLGR